MYTIYAYTFKLKSGKTYFYVGQTRRDIHARINSNYHSTFARFLEEHGLSELDLLNYVHILGQYPTPDYESRCYDDISKSHPSWIPLNAIRPQETKKHYIYLHAYKLNGIVYYYVGRTTRPNHRFTQAVYYGAFGQFINDNNITKRMLKKNVNILEVTLDATRESYWLAACKRVHPDWVNLNTQGCSEAWEDWKAKRKAENAERVKTDHYREMSNAKNARRSQFASEYYGMPYTAAYTRGILDPNEYALWKEHQDAVNDPVAQLNLIRCRAKAALYNQTAEYESAYKDTIRVSESLRKASARVEREAKHEAKLADEAARKQLEALRSTPEHKAANIKAYRALCNEFSKLTYHCNYRHAKEKGIWNTPDFRAWRNSKGLGWGSLAL